MLKRQLRAFSQRVCNQGYSQHQRIAPRLRGSDPGGLGYSRHYWAEPITPLIPGMQSKGGIQVKILRNLFAIFFLLTTLLVVSFGTPRASATPLTACCEECEYNMTACYDECAFDFPPGPDLDACAQDCRDQYVNHCANHCVTCGDPAIPCGQGGQWGYCGPWYSCQSIGVTYGCVYYIDAACSFYPELCP